MTTLYENHAASRLLFDLDAADTEFILQAGEGELFPNPQGDDFFWITLDAGEDGLEIMKVINRVQDTLSVVRAQQGSPAQAFLAGTIVDGRLTKSSLDNFLQKTGGSMSGNIRMGGNAIKEGIIEDCTLKNVALEDFTTDITLELPAGLICMWSGTDVDIPSGWALCDGQNGTPDLQDRFILGASPTVPTNAVGGAEDYSTEECGPHDHGAVTGGHAITEAQMPEVTVKITRETYDIGPGGHNPVPRQWRVNAYKPEGYHIESGPIGGGMAHSHTIEPDGVHQHAITGIRPPYYALAFIIKT